MQYNIKIDYLKHSIAYITSGKKEIERYIEYWRCLSFAFTENFNIPYVEHRKRLPYVTQKKVTLCYTEKGYPMLHRKRLPYVTQKKVF